MRIRFLAIFYILVLTSVWSQDAAAGVSEQPSAPSAFDILGVTPLSVEEALPEASTLNAVDTAIVSNETPAVDKPIVDEDIALPASDQPVVVEAAEAAEEEAAVLEEEAAVLEEEAAVLEEEPVVLEEEAAVLEEEPVVVEEEAVVVEEEAVVVEEEAVVVEEEPVVVEEEPAIASKEDITAETPVVESADELVLMTEIARLLAERDELYSTINELKAENIVLTEQASDAEFYKNRVAELEMEIARLEGVIVENEAALAAADIRLAEIESLLVEEGELLADAEARLAVTGGDTEAVSSVLAEKDAELVAKDAEISVQAAELSVRDATITIKDAEISEKTAIIASKEDELLTRESTIAAKDKVIADMNARLEAAQAEAAAALDAAKATGTVVQTVPGAPAVAPVAAVPAPAKGYLSGWKLDTSKFTKNVRDGFEGSSARMGSWKIAGATASQSDASQYFSRLELPLAQGKAPMLYRFKARSTGKGWIGLGLHLYVEDVLKKRGYGEGKSLLVWFTRDRDTRGDNATYLQLYRSDNDVVMERMFDAELQDGIDVWRLVEVVYDPGAEYIAVSVDGVLRIVYKTFFGRDAGATAALRTLGGGVSFSEFSAWTE